MEDSRDTQEVNDPNDEDFIDFNKVPTSPYLNSLVHFGSIQQA